ncbi:8634_t:CDS:2 [Ambispora leptoticha]|uniref:8634_t:CDS:1 n=1 Tax=Ambispora leptoticha TaxID=144679 RepID=A0A9N9DPP7_9GLOM|nr:8634_t:CDS:2 [Ambispora leptoticha]
MARKYPKSDFVGIDFSPIFPTEGFPGNIKFVNSNFLDGPTFDDSYFDFTHQKFMSVSFTEQQWEKQVIPELLRITKPGGWIEIVEADIIVSTGKVTQRLMNGVRECFKSKGLNIQVGESIIPQIIENTNAFSEIKKKKKSIPLGKKGGKSGQETLKFYTRAYDSARMLLSSSMNITPEHFDALVETVSIEADKFYSYTNHYRIYGQKR